MEIESPRDFNHGMAAIREDSRLELLFAEILSAIEAISEDEIIAFFEKQSRSAKSISEAINKLLDRNLVSRGWDRQSPIYKDESLNDKTWTLDFSKGSERVEGKQAGIPIEVVFNHGEAVAWNLIKLSLASESNVRKKFDYSPSVGVYICANAELKDKGGFDGAIGEYERVLQYLNPMDIKIPKPLVIIGLKAPLSFYIERYPNDFPITAKRGRSTGKLIRI